MWFFDKIQHGYTGMRWHLQDYRDYEEMQRIMMWKVHKVKFICNKNNFPGVNVYSNIRYFMDNNWFFLIYFYIFKIFLHRV